MFIPNQLKMFPGPPGNPLGETPGADKRLEKIQKKAHDIQRWTIAVRGGMRVEWHGNVEYDC